MDTDSDRMNRRDAVKWIAASFATVSLLDARAFGQEAPARPYGTDPNLLAGEVTWPRTLTPAQLRTVSALCDTILPADERSPSASKLKVPDFIDEWISAPYDKQQADRDIVLRGIDWLNAESNRRYKARYEGLDEAQQHAICDEICYLPKAKPAYQQAAEFFAKFRNIAAGGYYTTQQGMREVGYIGNTPLPTFEGPTPAVLKHLGLA